FAALVDVERMPPAREVLDHGADQQAADRHVDEMGGPDLGSVGADDRDRYLDFYDVRVAEFVLLGGGGSGKSGGECGGGEQGPVSRLHEDGPLCCACRRATKPRRKGSGTDQPRGVRGGREPYSFCC